MGIRKDKVTIQDALDRCLDDLYSGGASIEQCLARYPEYASELRPLLRTAERLEAVAEVRPSKAWKARLRKQLAGEPERPKRSLFGLRFVVLFAVVVFLVASLAVWMGINLEVAGGSLTPLPPMTNFFSPQPVSKATTFANRSTPAGHRTQIWAERIAAQAGARVGPAGRAARQEIEPAVAKGGNGSTEQLNHQEGDQKQQGQMNSPHEGRVVAK